MWIKYFPCTYFSDSSNFLIFRKGSRRLHALEELDVVGPDSVTLYVETHLVQSKVVSLRHLLLVVLERGLGLLDVEEVGSPQVNVQDADQATLEQLGK